MRQSRIAKIRDCVVPAQTWNPAKEGGNNEIQYIDLSSVDNQAKIITGQQRIKASDAPSRARQLVHAGDILVSTVRPNLNGVATVPPNLDGATASTGFTVLRPSPKISPAYLFQWVKSPAFVAEMMRKATGQSYPAVSDRIVLESEIPLPPLDEQWRIAAILDQADDLRRKRRESQTKIVALIQSIFFEMFVRVSDPAFSSRPLLDILARPLQNGAYYPESMYSKEDDGIEMVHMSDAFDDVVRRGDLRRVNCPASDLAKYALCEQDLLIARRSLTYAGAAKPCMIPSHSAPLIFESSFIRITPQTNQILPDYLFHYLNNDYIRDKYVRPYVTQSTISGVNQGNLERVIILVPPIEAQLKFSAILKNVRDVQIRHIMTASELDKMFAALQHRAFNAEL